MLIAGLDEAGRGPVIGSLVIGCVILKEENLSLLESIGVNDSKQLSPQKRKTLVQKIKEIAIVSKTKELPAQELNRLHNKGLTLNQIEVLGFSELLNEIEPKPEIIYLDAADVNEERFASSIQKHLNFSPKKIISKHKGDSLFKIVGAASILAKVERDEIIETLKEKYGDFGSGYPSDPKTKRFLLNYYSEHRKFPEETRLFWKTVENIKKQVEELQKQKENTKMKQRKITDFK